MGLPIRRVSQGSRSSNFARFSPAPASNGTLQGWKEIAMELDRSVRTVQRWQRKLNLPVHKLGTGNGCPVFAFEDELQSWLRSQAAERKKTTIAALAKQACPNEDSEPSTGEQRYPTIVKGRQNSPSEPTASEPEIIKSLNAFFTLKRANNSSHLCNHCHAATRQLVGHFWLYGTDRTWQVSVPFCPDCDSDLRAMLPASPEHITQ